MLAIQRGASQVLADAIRQLRARSRIRSMAQRSLKPKAFVPKT